MIERKFVSQNIKEFQIQEYLFSRMVNSGCSHIKLARTPLGDKVAIYTSRPGIVVGRKGQNIKALTEALRTKFKLENPQVEIVEVKEPFLNSQIVADTIASFLVRFGPQRFKGIAHKTIANVIGSGARGVELLISGKIPGSRAKNWRFSQGYLKKCGDVAIEGIDSAQSYAHLKAGTIGIQVKIMPPDLILPDSIEIFDEPQEIVVKELKTKRTPKGKKSTKKTARKTTKKTTKKVVKETTAETVKESEKEVTADAPKKESPVKENDVKEESSPVITENGSKEE